MTIFSPSGNLLCIYKSTSLRIIDISDLTNLNNKILELNGFNNILDIKFSSYEQYILIYTNNNIEIYGINIFEESSLENVNPR